MKVQQIFDVRWVFSSFIAVRAILRDYAALHRNFLESSENINRNSKERSKYKELAKKLQTWFFVSESCLLKDSFLFLKQLSLFLQNSEASVMNAMDHIDNLKEKLLGLKTQNGKSFDKFVSCFTVYGSYKGIKIIKTDVDEQKLVSFRRRFFQALHDNVVQRFPTTDVLFAARILKKLSWPTDPLQKSLFGEKEIGILCTNFNIDSS